MEEINSPTKGKIAWSLAEISEKTGLSVGFLNNERKAGHLPIKKFGRRVLVLDEDLRKFSVMGEPHPPGKVRYSDGLSYLDQDYLLFRSILAFRFWRAIRDCFEKSSRRLCLIQSYFRSSTVF
jgi:hypothetical protein